MKPTTTDRSQKKKFKRTHSMTHLPAVGLGSLSAGLSSATLAIALTGFGIVASPTLAGVATIFGLLSVGFTVMSKKRISESEFTIIVREVQKYHELKAAIREGEKQTKAENKETQTPDLDKLEGELRKEIKQEFQKKINLLAAVSKSDLRY